MSTAAHPNKATNSAGTPPYGSGATGYAVDRELKVIIRPLGLDFWEYEGTRAQLEAEGVIPPDIEWPSGADSCDWEAERFCWRLQRTRPEGLKGPMRLWASGDWWMLRCWHKHGLDREALDVRAAELALQEAMYRNSPAGRRERSIAFGRYWAAHEDKAFQAFKLSIPGFDSKKRRAGRAAP